MQLTAPRTAVPRTIGRVALGTALLFAGISHLTVAREEFQAQVPPWLPLKPDTVVVLSGIVEISLGGALIVLGPLRIPIGFIVAAFFVAIFPGNIAQYVEARDGFGLDTDAKRLARLPFQVVLVLWALWSTGAWRDRRRLLRR
ncbi:MAG: DoxX family membrane protein [Aeromicrobium sp.]